METAWLIEISMKSYRRASVWWTGDYRTGSITDQWSTDSLDGVRFSRKQDAERVIDGTLRMKGRDEAVATEHVWQ